LVTLSSVFSGLKSEKAQTQYQKFPKKQYHFYSDVQNIGITDFSSLEKTLTFPDKSKVNEKTP
jgi:hypothetical protein